MQRGKPRQNLKIKVGKGGKYRYSLNFKIGKEGKVLPVFKTGGGRKQKIPHNPKTDAWARVKI